jgi:ABC-type spermidine/putrescine transport systems, ATPase components
MLKLLQLENFGARQVTQLSGGQRQRVALGRALAVDPRLLLLDEPMSNLDYKVRLELRHELRALQQRIGITAVYVTHDREEALTLADRIAVIDAGRIVQIGAPEEIFHRPTSAFVAGFMGADNALDVSRAGDGALKAIGLDTEPEQRIRVHFRSDSARLAPAAAVALVSVTDAPGSATNALGNAPTTPDSVTTAPDSVTNAPALGDLVLTGVVAQSVYVGQGYRYRVRTDDADIWVHASERVAEGTPTCVVVPRDALLLFPTHQPRSP